MTISVVGINFKTAPVAIREKVYFGSDKVSLYLQDLLACGHTPEAVLLSTCNRSELYCDTTDIHAVCDWFCAQTTIPKQELLPLLYTYQDGEAIAHMMQVACGLDSMVLGESQILGQLKEAFSESCTAGAVGAVFNRLFQHIFSVAKDIRTSTSIGACPVSVASAAVHYAKQHVNIDTACIAMIGAGDTATLLLRYLQPHATQPILLVNRSADRAANVVSIFECVVQDLEQALIQADVVFTATGSATPIIQQAFMARVMQKRKDRPIMFMDIAVPRDVDASVRTLSGVHLHCIDDLMSIIEKNRQGRTHAADQAAVMIAKKSRECYLELHSIDKIAHAISAYRGQIEELCNMELQKAKRLLKQGGNAADILEEFAYAYTQKLLHGPSVQLRQAGVEGRFELLRFAKQLFSLPDPETELT